MKIAQLCPYDIHRPGGVQRHIIDLSTALSQMGHDVSIIAPRVSGNGNRLTHTDVSTLPIVYVGRGVLVPLNKTQFEITWALGEQLKHLDEVLQSSEFDVIHFHTVSAPFLPMQALRKSRAANVATFHEVPPDTMTGSIQQFLLRVHRRRLISRLDRVILASGAQKAISLTQDLSRISIVPPCSDLARFHADAAPIDHYRDERMNILFLGRLEPRKGALVLLKAFHELRRQGLPVRLLLAGDGPQRSMLERFAKKQRMSDVVFLGGIEDAALPRLYATCDIFCAPSLYAEGFGIVLAEAMAAGKPVAAAANAGYQTLLSGEAARFLVRPGDVGALARALKELVMDASLRARLGEWGRREAKRYDNHALAPKFLTIYREAIRSRFGP